MQNHLYENEFDLHEKQHVGGTHFHMNGFALRLVLTRRQKGTQKWPIDTCQNKVSADQYHVTIVRAQV